MSTVLTAADRKLSPPRNKMRFFDTEDKEMVELAEKIGPTTGLSVADLIRHSVRAGWPKVKAQLQKS